MHKLRKFRQEKKITLQQLGDVIGKPREFIYQLEKGLRPLQPPIAQKLADFLQIPIDVLYGEDSIKVSKYLYTTLQNIVSIFNQKGIKYDNYQNNEFETEIYYYDKALFPIISAISTPQKLNIKDFEVLKEITDMMIINKEQNFDFDLLNGINKFNQPPIETFNKRIDRIIELIKEYKIEIKGEEK